MAETGVQENDRVTVTPRPHQKLESRSFKTESGIEIKIPAELCSSDDAVEFIHSATGGVEFVGSRTYWCKTKHENKTKPH